MPSDVLNLDAHDWDIGSSGPLLIPGSPDPQRIVAGGKNGILYVLNTAALGGFNATTRTSVQQLSAGASATVGASQIVGGPVFWDAPAGPKMFVWPSQTPLRAYAFNRSTGSFTTPSTDHSTNLDSFFPGGELSLSANGSTPGTGILWATHASNGGSGGGGVTPGVLIAFNAETMAELWRSDAHPLASFSKFTSPTVANGRVYVPTFSNVVQVYGLRAGGADAGAPDAGTPPPSLITCDAALQADIAAGKVQPTTFSYLFNNYFAVTDPSGAATPGQCATAGCHGSTNNGGFLCGTTKDSCYAGLKATEWLNSTDGTQSPIGIPAQSPLSWFGMPSPMPKDVVNFMPLSNQASNMRAAAAVCGWVRAGAQLDCTAPQLACSGVCTDVTRDNAHCGNCTTVCAAGSACTNGKCLSAIGSACAAGTECSTGVCADGHCCNTGCTGSCLSCTTGTCSAVKSAEDADTCSGTKMCDATGTCSTRISTFTYPTVGGGAMTLASRSDGTLWFPERTTGLVGKVTIATGAITEINPVSPYGSGWANASTRASDGTIWYTDQAATSLGRINPQGQFTFFSLASLGGFPQGVATRSTNEVWVALWGSSNTLPDHIAHLDATTGAVVASFALPAHTGPYGMIAGPDGNIWFAETNTPGVGRITPTGTITSFPIPSSVAMEPVAIAAGPDGALWFGGNASDAMGRITTSGVMTFFAAGDIIGNIVAGPDGNLWYTGLNGTLGRMTPTGIDTVYSFPGAMPDGIAVGSDGNIWFTDVSASQIVRFRLH